MYRVPAIYRSITKSRVIFASDQAGTIIIIILRAYDNIGIKYAHYNIILCNRNIIRPA